MWRELQGSVVRTLCIICCSVTWQFAFATSFVFHCDLQTALGALSFSGDVMLNTGTPNGPAHIGRTTVGTVQLDNGSAFSSGQTQFGTTPTGIGFGTVNGPRSTWSMGTADVGFAGIGRLDIQDGGIVDVMSGLRIGGNARGHGTVVVDGAGSILQVRGGPLDIGRLQSGALEISAGAIVNVAQPQTIVGPQGRVTLNGGLLRTSSLQNDGLVSGSGEINLGFGGSIFHAGRLEAGEGEHLLLSGSGAGSFQNQGLIAVDGGEIEFMRPIINTRRHGFSAAEITLRNGTLRFSAPSPSGFPTPLRNSGLIASLGGENHIYGVVENVFSGPPGTAEIAVTNGSTMIFHDDVAVIGGTMTVFPGSKATLLEDLTLGSTAMLLADIAGSDIETDYGEIEVVGAIHLGGFLRPVLSEGFMPQAGDSFEILRSVAGISGTITLADAPLLPGRLVWDLDVTQHQVLLNVATAPTGDYNFDGIVDASDFTIWQDSFGATGEGLAADGNLDGSVNEPDYALWKSNFGQTVGGAGAVAGVPEAASLILFFIGGCFALSCRQRGEWGG